MLWERCRKFPSFTPFYKATFSLLCWFIFTCPLNFCFKCHPWQNFLDSVLSLFSKLPKHPDSSIIVFIWLIWNRLLTHILSYTWILGLQGWRLSLIYLCSTTFSTTWTFYKCWNKFKSYIGTVSHAAVVKIKLYFFLDFYFNKLLIIRLFRTWWNLFSLVPWCEIQSLGNLSISLKI